MYVSMVQNSIMKISKYGLNNKGQNGLIPLFGKICKDLSLFAKYLAIYHIFELQICKTWVLENWNFLKKITFIFAIFP